MTGRRATRIWVNEWLLCGNAQARVNDRIWVQAVVNTKSLDGENECNRGCGAPPLWTGSGVCSSFNGREAPRSAAKLVRRDSARVRRGLASHS